MTVSDRRREISDLLLQKGKVKVGDLARRFQVSTETIRKDLLELEAQGFIKKIKVLRKCWWRPVPVHIPGNRKNS